MTEAPIKPSIYRVLVALDASVRDLSALEAAADLAGGIPVELLGLFVEDINLLRLAALPFAREVAYGSAGDRPFDVQSLEREFRAQAERLRRSLAVAAYRMHGTWSFRVVRGDLAAELTQAARDVDLLVFGEAAYAFAGLRPGLSTPALAFRLSRNVAWLRRPGRAGAPVLVLFDGSEASFRALARAAQLARRAHTQVVVLISAAAPGATSRLRAEAMERLAREGLPARHLLIAKTDASSLLHAARSERAGILLVPADGLPVSEEVLRAVLARSECSVVLVR